MKVNEWLEFFRKHIDKTLFSIHDIVQLTGEDKDSLTVQLHRLVSSDVILREARGWYANPFNPPSSEEVAMVLRYPSYLSMEYALSRHGILSQRVHTLTLITTKLPYVYKRDRATYEYHQVKRSLFWGFDNIDGIRLASREKAFLDFIYIRRRELDQERLSSLLDDMYLEELDMDRLKEYFHTTGVSFPVSWF